MTSGFAVEDAEEREIDRIVKSVVNPRPIAWVSTVDEEGRENLAPFSAYNYVSSAPPVVLFSSSQREGRFKDSARNAVETGEFAVNVVTERLAEAMDATSAGLEPGESEFEFAGVESAPCEVIAAPRVADAVATLECRLHDTVEVYGRLVVFGEAVYVHLDDEVTTDGRIDARKVDTVGRLGGPYYTVSEPMEFERQH
jgi:flavin reductase (DIM6/NTAB) family NADH-FMN oxidoreductase RutF